MSHPTEVIGQATEKRTPDEAERFRFGWRYAWKKDEDGLMVQVRVPLTPEDVLHPQEEDFIVNNPAHGRDCRYLESVLRRVLGGRAGVEILRDVRVDWGKENVPVHGPDLVVFEDVRQPWRLDVGTFHVRAHAARPLLLIEVTSPGTRSQDLDDKVVEYCRAGVPWYFIVDYRPELDERQVRVLGYRGTSEGAIRLNPDDQGRIWMEPVGLWLASAGDRALCLSESGERIEDPEDAVRRAEGEADEARRDAKLARADSDEARREAKIACQEADEARKQATDLAARVADLEERLRRLESPPT